MTLLVVFVAAGLVYALWLVGEFLVSTTRVMRTQTVAESAALAAANELSRIVIEDPHFGYVGLSETPPVKAATMAGDGEPLPVSSINAIVAGARQEMIIADLLHNDYMQERAKTEMVFAQGTARRMEAEMLQCLKPNSTRKITDLDGVPIEPYRVAWRIVQASTRDTGKSSSAQGKSEPDLILRLGWVEGQGTTLQPAARMQNRFLCPSQQQTDGFYKPSVDLFYGGQSFYLASVGAGTTLINGDRFSAPDGIRLSSVVQAQINCRVGDANVCLKACAQPGASCAMTPAGSLVVDRRDGRLGLDSLGGVVRAQQSPATGCLQTLSALGGDFPGGSATLSPVSGVSNLTAADALGLALFDWIRSAHGRVNIDSLLAAIDTPFPSSQRYCRYDIGLDGRVLVSNANLIAFDTSQVCENQIYCYSPQAIISPGGGRCAITLFDNVYQLGNLIGGRHAGQAIEGESINWMDLARYGGSREQESSLQRGEVALRIHAVGDSSPVASGGVCANRRAIFETPVGAAVREQPRRSYLCGGLAVLIQLSHAL